jgi:hypothetical protein
MGENADRRADILMRRPSKKVIALQAEMSVELQTYGRASVQLVYPTRCSIFKTALIRSLTQRSSCNCKSNMNSQRPARSRVNGDGDSAAHEAVIQGCCGK